ncbi:kinase-like protein [Violaceomyces palustris]|uniref:Kinase-like protein n=1 Tax=Violaceomyces palustris TaxID=1673888 RepID=A0ACD0NMM7_9BASI|nr:kinase-like protein [Violaceomyces palustris]
MKKGEVSTASSLLQQLEGVSLRRKKSNASIKSSSKAAPPEAIPEETPQSSPVPVKSTTQAPLLSLLSDPEITKMIKQGAEAKVYISRFLPPSVVTFPPSFKPGSIPYQAPSSLPPLLLKHRFPKTYRHPTLSSSITSSRTIMEARALLRCARAGVAVPGVRLVDEREGILGLELIEGKSVREWLGGGAEGEEDKLLTEEEERQAEEDVLDEKDQIRLMDLIGTSLARMHEADIIHGDLTTSNMMLRRNPSVAGQGTISENGVGPNDEVVLIDFGLSSVSSLAEDKAVDLYVLERAFASTHPHSEGLYKRILESYAEETIRRSGSAKKKGSRVDKWEEIRRRLEEGLIWLE